MAKDNFERHMEQSVQGLIDFTCQYCYNDIAQNYLYIVEPSGIDHHDAMTDFDKQRLKKMLRFRGKYLTKEQVVNLLFADGMIPNWINISVYESCRNKTVVHILATREWRTYAEAEAKFPLREFFHAVVPMPPNDLKQEADGKFDVNWRKNRDNARSGNVLIRLRHFFRNL